MARPKRSPVRISVLLHLSGQESVHLGYDGAVFAVLPRAGDTIEVLQISPDANHNIRGGIYLTVTNVIVTRGPVVVCCERNVTNFMELTWLEGELEDAGYRTLATSREGVNSSTEGLYA